jgi:hypothetical protein
LWCSQYQPWPGVLDIMTGMITIIAIAIIGTITIGTIRTITIGMIGTTETKKFYFLRL